MAPNPRVTQAFRAMKAIGITEAKVKPVLKKLLKLYDKNWELIEEENYRVLADAIFEDDDPQVPEEKENGNGENFGEEPERPLKRLRLRGQEGQPSSSLDNSNPDGELPSLKRPKLENEQQLSKNSLLQQQDMRQSEHGPVSPQNHTRNMGKQLASPIRSGVNSGSNLALERNLPSDSQSPQVRHSYKGKEPLIQPVSSKEKRPIMERPSHAVRIRDPVTDPGIVRLPKHKVPDSHALIIPKDEPFTDDFPPSDSPRPIAVIRPAKANGLVRSVSKGKPDSHASPVRSEEDRRDNIPVSSNEAITNSDLAAVPEESSANLEIASSSLGEVKLSLSCNSMIGRPNFHMPSQDELLKSMQEKCLRSYKILDPKFSVMQLLKDVCECFLDLATDSSHESQEGLLNVSPTVSALKGPLSFGGIGGSNYIPAEFSNGSIHGFPQMTAHQIPKQLQLFSEDTENNGKELRDSESRSLVVVPQYEFTSEELRSLHGIGDITKGEELVEISWLNEINNECPTSFNYIVRNLVYQNALVKFTLSQIKPEDCCPSCLGDCLTSICVCASETGDQFAYTAEGLIREDFLDECISITRDAQRQCHSYCKACPLERSKNDEILEPCKGHLKRKFIKECWVKCACHKQCGNRVVQRGIRCKLQVFFTSEGKGWGLRTLEKLPKGAFVCEFVGEILTNKELHERNMQRIIGTSSDRHTYPVILDAYWCLKGALEEDEALCLDATFYGNVARFINHRCLDANLIEIPVKMETPDHHYYHLAFFTTRDVNPLEELTWDYGIDFDDNDHPVELFRCQCGSKFCRNMKRPSRSKLLK